MKKLFPGQYWACWGIAAVFFAAVFPYAMFADPDVLPVYAWFCTVLNGLSALLFRAMLLRIWVRRLYSDQFSKYAWVLGVQAFCHLVFGRMNAASYGILGITVIFWLWMLWAWCRERLAERKKNVE